jgi:DNA-binding NarL/FixJ family response regulator
VQSTNLARHCRVIIAEDDILIRQAIRSIAETCCEVIAEADNGQVALHLVEEFHPDIVLLDISMPVLNGLEAARFMKNHLPDVRIIIVSSHADPAYVEQAFQAGAQAYVHKSSAVWQIPRAIEDVISGRTFRPE